MKYDDNVQRDGESMGRVIDIRHFRNICSARTHHHDERVDLRNVRCDESNSFTGSLFLCRYNFARVLQFHRRSITHSMRNAI